VASVSYRSFMSSKSYLSLVDFLTDYQEDSTFRGIYIERDTDFVDGLLVYGNTLDWHILYFGRNKNPW
jgi:hypothetical protein